MSSKFYAVVIGAGPGIGRASAVRLSKAYPVVLLARSAKSYEDAVKEINDSGGKAIGISTDSTSVESLNSAFETISKELPDHKLAAAVYNVAAWVPPKPFTEATLEELNGSINANIRGFFHFAQKTLPLLEASVGSSRYPPSLIVSGATASVRGTARFGLFAAGSWGRRALTQSLAREYAPKGVHVAHAVIDGVIDLERTAHFNVNGGMEDSKISADSIAETYWSLHTQHRSGFTWEVDIRPYVEKW